MKAVKNLRVLQALLLVNMAFQVYDRNVQAVLGWGCALLATRSCGVWKDAR